MIESFILGVLIGLCIGGVVLKSMYQKNVIASKAEDGTAEYIDGKAYYIITNDDWRLLEAWRLPILRREASQTSEESP